MAPLGPLFRRAAEGLKARAGQRLPGRILKVVVFGSVARGEAGPDSDLDLCIIVDDVDPELHHGVFRALYEVYEELDYPFVISPTLMSEGHFDRLAGLERRLAADILREGVPV